jgi:radical SAM-linked protein
LIHLWEKALRRAGLPLAYSQGFSPHPKIFIALPLPVGVTSEAELMEIGFSEQLTPEYFAGRVAHQLPPGISVGEVREAPGRGKALQALVRAAEYRVLVADERPEGDLEKAIDDLLSAAQLPREWVREKGVRRYDLRPLVVRVWLIGEERGYWSLGMVLRAGPQGAGRPEEVLASLGCSARARLIHRVRLILEEQDE